MWWAWLRVLQEGAREPRVCTRLCICRCPRARVQRRWCCWVVLEAAGGRTSADKLAAGLLHCLQVAAATYLVGGKRRYMLIGAFACIGGALVCPIVTTYVGPRRPLLVQAGPGTVDGCSTVDAQGLCACVLTCRTITTQQPHESRPPLCGSVVPAAVPAGCPLLLQLHECVSCW